MLNTRNAVFIGVVANIVGQRQNIVGLLANNVGRLEIIVGLLANNVGRLEIIVGLSANNVEGLQDGAGRHYFVVRELRSSGQRSEVGSRQMKIEN